MKIHPNRSCWPLCWNEVVGWDFLVETRRCFLVRTHWEYNLQSSFLLRVDVCVALSEAAQSFWRLLTEIPVNSNFEQSPHRSADAFPYTQPAIIITTVKFNT